MQKLRTSEVLSMRRLLIPIALLLPAALLYTAVRTLGELEQQREVYLRSRVAAIAARLETLAENSDVSGILDDEPGLVDLVIIGRSSPKGSELAPLWEGRELFRTQTRTTGDVFRAYVPFHSPQGMLIGRIDLSRRSADFLVVHARRNVIAAVAASLAVLTLAMAVVWSTRRTARLEQRQLELEHLAQIGKMAAALAHEIRNPLGTIKGFAQLLGEGGADGALVGPILTETTRLENLVRDLLLYGKPPVPNLRRVEWEDIASLMRAHAECLRPTLRFRVESSAVTFETDPNLLEQALLNLVRNALEAAEAEVSLHLRHNGSISILVEDDGPGFAPEAQQRLYEPFFTTKPLGTGLGLAISKKLAAALGGRLSIGPRRAKGTVARLELPWNAS